MTPVRWRWAPFLRAPLFAALTVLVLAPSLLAHELPETFGVALRDGEVEGVVTSRGIVPSASSELTCRQWFGLAAVERPALIPLVDGAWLFATSRGAFRGTTDGCAWEEEPSFEGTVLTGVVPRAMPRIDAVAIGVGSGVLDGVIGVSPEGLGTLLVPSAADEFVASVYPSGEASAYVLWVRIDEVSGRPAYRLSEWTLNGGSSTALRELGEVPFTDDDVRVLLAGVDTTGEPLLEVTRYEVTGLPALLLGRDGSTWRERWSSVGPLFSVRSPDETLWLGSEEGLFREEGAGVVEVSSAFPIASMRWSDDALYAGSRYPLGPMVAVWREDDGVWDRVREFLDVTPSSSCATPEDLPEACREEWADWALDIVPILEEEADAGADAGETPEDAPTPGGNTEGCATARGGAPSPWGALGALGLVLGLRRRAARSRVRA